MEKKNEQEERREEGWKRHTHCYLLSSYQLWPAMFHLHYNQIIKSFSKCFAEKNKAVLYDSKTICTWLPSNWVHFWSSKNYQVMMKPTVLFSFQLCSFIITGKKDLKKWWVYLVLGFGAKVLRFLPAASRQVKDGSGSHVSSFGIMGVVVCQWGAFPITVEAETRWWWLGEWRLSCRGTKAQIPNWLIFWESTKTKGDWKKYVRSREPLCFANTLPSFFMIIFCPTMLKRFNLADFF